MSEGADVLLLADEATAAALHRRAGGERFAPVIEPYEALDEMERRRWPAVVLTGPRPDFAGLCRAARRLQPTSALYGLVTPAAEPEARLLVGEALDDYFIRPPARQDVERILAGADAAAAGRSQADGESLSPQDLAALLDAANTVASLERCAAELIHRRSGEAATWCNAGAIPPGRHALLLAASETPRVLAAATPRAKLSPAARRLVGAVEQHLPALMAVARRTETLHRLAITDPLTGAYNRRYFYHVTDEVLRRSERKGLRATLLLYDIDDFKRYNDTYGYAVGDEILREIASLMRETSRRHDIIARIGGDEFAMLFWDFEGPRQPGSLPLKDPLFLAERLRKAVHGHEFAALGDQARGVLSISGGLAQFPGDGHTCRELLRSADLALKRVKQSGKNAIQLLNQP